MTERETQILQWIKEDPLISQQEIADRANIARSSVAVHISNLMKKGKIVGKGYVVHEEGYVTVIGGANMDIIGTTDMPLIDEDSNPGVIRFIPGGVGRNIAENLSRLGRKVEFITALGDDTNGQEIQKNCRQLGIGIQNAMIHPKSRTSTYLCINDHSGDMKLAVNDMKIYELLSKEFLQAKLDLINRSELLIIDANLSEESIIYLAENCRVPIIAEPVSTNKALKFKSIISYIDTLKPNRIEMEVLSGIKITDEESLKKAADKLIEEGVKNLFISLSSKGVYYANKDNHGILSNYPSKVINTTGCGDAFIAAVAYAKQEGFTIEDSAKLGLSAASICTETMGAISKNLTLESIYNRIENK